MKQEVNGLLQVEIIWARSAQLSVKWVNLTARLCLVTADWSLHGRRKLLVAGWEGKACSNSTSQDSNYPDDLFQSRYVTPGFKPFSEFNCTTVCSNQIPHFSKTKQINNWSQMSYWKRTVNETNKSSGEILRDWVHENHWITLKRIWTLMWGLGRLIDRGNMLAAKK